MAIFSEILRFVLPPSKAKAIDFLRLRQQLAKSNGIRGQYFGYIVPIKGSALPAREHEMCWVIRWLSSGITAHAETNVHSRSQLTALTTAHTYSFIDDPSAAAKSGTEPRSLIFPFSTSQLPELTKALEAPICELAFIALPSPSPKSDPQFNISMGKTFTDCYLAPGFQGGAWAYASNTNDTIGILMSSTPINEWDDASERMETESASLAEEERHLACYFLGWESTEHHHVYSHTPLFAEEIDKLSPYFASGTGAWYVKLEKHDSNSCNSDICQRLDRPV